MNLSEFTKPIAVFFYEIIKFLCWLLPIIFFSYLSLSFLLYFLFPDFPIDFSAKTILSLTSDDLALILIILFFLTILGIYFRYRENKIKINFMRFDSKSEVVVALVTSFFFSTFLVKSLFVVKNFEFIPIVIFTFIIFLFLPHLISFYSSVDLSFFKKNLNLSEEKNTFINEIKNYLKSLVKILKIIIVKLVWLSLSVFIILLFASISKNFLSVDQLKMAAFLLLILFIFLIIKFTLVYQAKFLAYQRKLKNNLIELIQFFYNLSAFLWRLIKKTVMGFTIISLFAIIVIVVITFLTRELNKYANYQRRLRENITIILIDPSVTTLAQKVSLKGYNFGWRVNKRDRLVSDNGPVVVDEWKEEEIIFTVPLHWKERSTNLWIERIKDDMPEKKLLKSNTISLKILSRWDFFPAEAELKRKDPFSYLMRAVKKIRRTLFLKKPYFP